MARTLLLPKMLALHLALVGVLVSFTFLGRWQLGVFEMSGSDRLTEAAAAPQAPIGAVAGPGERFGIGEVGREVTAEGTFGPDQLLVAREGGGFWVLAPLDTADGLLPVVRGRVGKGPAPAVPEGEVTVSGRLQIDEDIKPPSGLPTGQVGRVSTADLVNLWQGGSMYGGYLVADEAGQGMAAVQPKLPIERTGVEWRNLAYAFQWWIFAAFAVFMWWKIVRDTHRRRIGEAN